MTTELPTSDDLFHRLRTQVGIARTLEASVPVAPDVVLALVECADALRDEVCTTMRVYGVRCRATKCARCAALAKLEAL